LSALVCNVLLSYRHLVEIMHERRVSGPFDGNRWGIRFRPLIEKLYRKDKHKVGISWRLDETYINWLWCKSEVRLE
jgi:putative transposase